MSEPFVRMDLCGFCGGWIEERNGEWRHHSLRFGHDSYDALLADHNHKAISNGWAE